MYEGFRYLSDQELAEYYEGKDGIKPKENEFFILESGQKLQFKNSVFVNISSKGFRNELGKISPKNTEQELALNLLLNDDIKLVVLTGKAGCGKTFLAAQSGLFKLEKNKYEKIFFIRNNVEVSKPLGALPGEKLDKIRPYMSSIVDQLGGWSVVYKLIEDNQLEVEALGYIQGRSIKNSFLLVDEAQNLTTAQAKMLITRVAEGSKMVMVGDLDQTANISFENGNSGLKKVIKAFAGQPLFGIVDLKKSERSELAELASRLL